MCFLTPINHFWWYKKCFVQMGHHNQFSAARTSQRVAHPAGELDRFSILTLTCYMKYVWKTGSGNLQLVSYFISSRFYHALPPEPSAGCPVISASLPVHSYIPIRGQVRQGFPLDYRLHY